jgi:hypothetical protein
MMPFNISEFQTYLDNITQKANLYTVIGAEGKMFDVGLMVRELQPKQCRVSSDNNKQENIELLPVLDGIRKYAIELYDVCCGKNQKQQFKEKSEKFPFW